MDKNIITPEIRNQSKCGSCWAFSSQIALEAAYNLSEKPTNPAKFSEKQLLDCATNRADSCKKGESFMVPAFYSTHGHGMTSDKNYPYYPVKENCHYSKIKNPTNKFASFSFISPGANSLKKTLQKTPVNVGIPINKNFLKYKSGIFDDENCAEEAIGGHAMAIVAYHKGNGDDEAGYFTLKNSWSQRFGENGYIRIKATGGKGICEIEGGRSSKMYFTY